MISIRQLASECGVSVATINRAIHGGIIKKETREKVLAIVKKHNYVPSPIVKETIYGKSDVVGLIAPIAASHFYVDFLDSLKNRLTQEGLELYITPAADTESTLKSLESFASRRAKAILLLSSTDGRKLPASIVENIPILSINHPVRQKHVQSLVPSFRQCGAIAARHLLDRGHRRVLYLRYCNEKGYNQVRYDGFADEMKEINSGFVSHQIDIMQSDWDQQLCEVIRNTPFTAVVISTLRLLELLLVLLERLRLSIPHDISVLSAGGTPRMLSPLRNISYVAYPMEKVVDQVARWLNDSSYRLSAPRFVLNNQNSVRDLTVSELESGA